MPTLRDTLSTMGTLLDGSEEYVLSTVPGGYRGEREETDGIELGRLVPHDYILQVEGDSMAPIYPEGTIVFVKKTPYEEPVLRRPNIILIDGLESTCAYVEETGEWGKYVLYKENGEYEERMIEGGRCRFQGVVVFHVAPVAERPRRKSKEEK